MLTDHEKLILEVLQQDIPLTRQPYKVMAERCAVSEEEFISSMKSLKERNLIRNISAIFKADKLGYKSILTAVKSNSPDLLAERINIHNGVSHNYLRQHEYNVWFTLTIPETKSFDDEIKLILADQEYESYHLFPSLKTFKIGVNFLFNTPSKSVIPINEKGKTLKSPEIPFVLELQKEFPASTTPWEVIAKNLNSSVDELFHKINHYKETGALKRVSAVLRHRNAGFTFNGMICFALPSDELEKAGRAAAAFSAVSHCYERPRYHDWPYNLFVMIHAQSEEESLKVIRQLAEAVGSEDYITLFSTKEYKKERVRYFTDHGE